MKVRELKSLIENLDGSDDVCIHFTDDIGDEKIGEITDVGWDGLISAHVIRSEQAEDEDELDDEIEKSD